MNFNLYEELKRAQHGDNQAAEQILQEFLPLIRKYRYINGRPDADLLGELYLAAYLCIMRFHLDTDDMLRFISEAGEG